MFRAHTKIKAKKKFGRRKQKKIVGKKTFFLDFVGVVFRPRELRHASHYYVTSRHVLLIKK